MSAPQLRLVDVVTVTDTGRIRSHNEDRSLVKGPMLAIADGMGGANAGEVAAEITVDALRDVASDATATVVRDAIIGANTAIRDHAEADPSHLGMGTTVTAALLDGTDITVLHVGDSRAYLWRDGTLRQVTDDHSMVAEMVRQGQITAAEAERHPARNVITRALGAEPNVIVDEVPLAAQPGDILLICSDGLSSLVHDRDIESIIAVGLTLTAAARELVKSALRAGGTDNITVILARVVDADDATETVEVASETDDTTRLPATPPEETTSTARTPVVLEPTSSGRASILRRVVVLGSVALVLIGGLAAWVGSRTYFVDGTSGQTARVYHGAPFSLLGLDLFGEWGDTGVDTGVIRAADRDALSRTARGQGEAVRHSVDLVWRFGLPTIPQITAPPTPPAAVPPPTPPAPAAPTP